MSTDISVSNISLAKISEASATLALCWKYAYKGLVDDAYLASLKDNHWVSIFEQCLNNNAMDCLIAQHDGKIIGVVIFGKSIEEQYPDDGEVLSLYVIPEFIGRGVGRLLFTKAQESLEQVGYKHCIVCAFVENSRAIRFYEAHGYEIVAGPETFKLGGQEQAFVIMRKKRELL